MSSPTACTHEHVAMHPTVVAIAEPVAFLFVTLRVRCDDCHVLFSFRGLNSGHPNPDVPVTSADGYELRAPIVPRAGGVVGILEATALTSRLRVLENPDDDGPY